MVVPLPNLVKPKLPLSVPPKVKVPAPPILVAAAKVIGPAYPEVPVPVIAPKVLEPAPWIEGAVLKVLRVTPLISKVPPLMVSALATLIAAAFVTLKVPLLILVAPR